MASYKEIYSFNSVNIKEKIKINDSLLVLDIDETILYFVSKNERMDKDWWKSSFDKYYLEYKDYEYAELLSYNDWLNHITHNDPYHTDKYNLFKLLDRYNNHIFITARDPYIKNITSEHMKKLNINVHDDNIYHVDKSNKGKILSNLLEEKYKDIKKVIFIDDLITNIDDVCNEFKTNDFITKNNIQLDCYLFKSFDRYY